MDKLPSIYWNKDIWGWYKHLDDFMTILIDMLITMLKMVIILHIITSTVWWFRVCCFIFFKIPLTWVARFSFRRNFDPYMTFLVQRKWNTWICFIGVWTVVYLCAGGQHMAADGELKLGRNRLWTKMAGRDRHACMPLAADKASLSETPRAHALVPLISAHVTSGWGHHVPTFTFTVEVC